jgi:hypothetical protein
MATAFCIDGFRVTAERGEIAVGIEEVGVGVVRIQIESA